MLTTANTRYKIKSSRISSQKFCIPLDFHDIYKMVQGSKTREKEGNGSRKFPSVLASKRNMPDNSKDTFSWMAMKKISEML
jgi:hypothetical protein